VDQEPGDGVAVGGFEDTIDAYCTEIAVFGQGIDLVDLPRLLPSFVGLLELGDALGQGRGGEGVQVGDEGLGDLLDSWLEIPQQGLCGVMVTAHQYQVDVSFPSHPRDTPGYLPE
jgi:hypothetical protein